MTKWNRWALALRWIALAWVGWYGAGTAAQAQAVRLAVSEGPVSLPIYVAESEHFFEREGVAVELRDCTSGRDCYGMLARGEVGLATAAELVLTLNSQKDPETLILAAISSSIHSIKLVARRDAGISKPEDLRGKRIGTTTGTSAQYFLDSWLVFHEIDPASVKTAALPPERLVSALEQHEVDAVATWEPVASNALSMLGAGGVLMPDPKIYAQHFCLMSNRKLVAEQGPMLVKLLRALARAERYIAANQEHAAQILGARLGNPTAVKGLAEHDFHLSLDQSLIATMDAQARWATGQGLLPHTARTGNLLHSIEPSLLRTAAPESVNLVQ